MCPRIRSLVYLVAVLALPGRNCSAADSPTITNCLVTLIEEAQVPAQESGVLMFLAVKPGVTVKKGQVLAQIDDAVIRSQRDGAEAEEKAAREKADNDIDVRYAIAASAVADAEFDKARAANRKTPGAISDVEVERLRLTSTKSKLQIEQARMERRVQGHVAAQKAAEVKTANSNMARHEVRSPINGVVVQVNGHVGEWVKPGDTILRIIGMDQLRVEGFVSAAQFNPGDINGHDVTINVTLARQESLKLPGQVVFVSPIVEAGGEFRVWADFDNRLNKKNDWAVRPGVNATMTIPLD